MIIYIDENDENKRLDSYLSEITPDLSRSKIQNFIKSGNVKINDSIKKPSYILKENDKIDFEIPEEEKLEIMDESYDFFFHHHTGSDRDVCLDILLFCRV